MKKPELTRAQSIAKGVAIDSHKRRIYNLETEIESLRNRLEIVEADFDMPRTDREKESEVIIRRLTLLQYEIDIRKETVKWLSS